MEKFVFANTGDKLSRQLLSLIDSSGKNYAATHIEVSVFDDFIEVSTFCANEYGSKWCNENHTTVSKGYVPFFVAKKLGMLEGC